MDLRSDWTKQEIATLYHQPLMELILQAAQTHQKYHKVGDVQVSALLSIKTGGCVEDCAYCPQAARYHTEVKVQALLPVEEVVARAQKAKEGGASRFCMGAAWREVRDNRDFDRVIEMVKAVNKLGMEVCCTLGMLTENQAKRLADAGLYAYNHNIDTSEDYYRQIIQTRQFGDRMETLDHVRKAGITVCSGGIIGLGESDEDRIDMLHTLATLPQHPESVPINILVPIKGTPLENSPRVPFYELVRMIATVRLVMPHSAARLSAGRLELSLAEQALCFLAGANSIFSGDQLLTTPNPEFSRDQEMFRILGLTPKRAFSNDERTRNTKAVDEAGIHH